MKQKLYIVLTIICAACLCLAACDDNSPLPAQDRGQEIQVIIPGFPGAHQLPLASARGGLQDKTQWQAGDLLYIALRCQSASTTHIAAYSEGGTWQFDKPLTLPPNTVEFSITAWYTAGSAPGEAITGDLLMSLTGESPETGFHADGEEPAVVLNAFDHVYARITFTGLAGDDELSFRGNGWQQCSLTDAYDTQQASPTIAPLTADADGQVALYARILANGDESAPALTREFCLNATGTDDKWYTFNPGLPNVEGSNETNYYNRAYTVDCEPLKASGGVTPEEMEIEERRAPFLAWAQSDRWKTEDFTLECDIDLTGVNWTPIGSYNNQFTGIFDGGGHTITGLTVDKSDANYIGLFGWIGSSGIVRNLTVKGGSVTGLANVGGMAGYNGGTISGCTFTGTVKGSYDYIGGITGFNNGRCIACLADGVTIEATDTDGVVCLGGIAGSNYGTLTACVAAPKTMKRPAGNINALAGGIVGENYATLSTCYWQTGIGGIGAIGLDDNPQGGNCTSFTPGQFDAGGVAALNAAINTYNAPLQEDDEKRCSAQWQASATEGGVPGVRVNP